jgi:outer membrane protein TolC
MRPLPNGTGNDIRFWPAAMPLFVILLLAFPAGCRVAGERQAMDDIHAMTEIYRAAEHAPEESLPEFWDESGLSDYLTYAALRNAELRGAFEEWKAAMEQIPQVRSLPDPMLTYGQYVRDVETKINRFALMQTFPWPGTLALRGEAAYENAEAKRQAYEAARLGLSYRVKEIYYEYYFLGRSIGIVAENLSLVVEAEKSAAERFRNDGLPYADLIRIQIEKARYGERLASLRDLSVPLLAKFDYVLNRPTDGKEAVFPFPAALDVGEMTLPDQSVLERQVRNNPRLREIAQLIEMEARNRDLARRRYIPDVGLGAEYEMMRRDRDQVIAMVSVNLPIYFSRYEAERREAEARKASREAQREDLEKMLLAELAEQLFVMRDAQRKMILYRDTLIPLARASRQVITRSYMVGNATYVDFIDAQRTLLDMELLFEENLLRYAKSLARIEELAATEFIHLAENVLGKEN